MYCKQCGKQLSDDAKFCRYCGESCIEDLSGGGAEQTADNGKILKADISSLSSENNDILQTTGSTAAVAVKNKKPVLIALITAIIVIVLAGAGIAYYMLYGSEAARLANAFKATAKAKSWKADYTFELLGVGSNNFNCEGTFETYLKDADSFFVASANQVDKYTDELEPLYVKAYCNNTLYSLNNTGRRPVYIKKDEGVSDICLDVANRDIPGVLKDYKKSNGKGEAYLVKKYIQNIDDLPEIFAEMLSDFYKNGKELSFVDKYSYSDNTYKFTLDIRELMKCAKREYGVKFNETLYSSALKAMAEEKISVTAVLVFELDGRYIKKMTLDVSISDNTGEIEILADAKFSNINDVSFESSKTAEFLDEFDIGYAEYQKLQLIKHKLETANNNAREASDYVHELLEEAEAHGYTMDDCFHWGGYPNNYTLSTDFVYNTSSSISDKGANEIAAKLYANLDNGGCFKICRYRDSYVVFWAESPDSTVVGCYPICIEWDDYDCADYKPTIANITTDDY